MTYPDPAAPNSPPPASGSGVLPPVPSRTDRTATLVLLVPALAGCAVATALGVYGRVHSPTGVSVNLAGFSSAQNAKAWLATVATALALVQLGSALVMYGKVPHVTAPSWIGGLHRWSGRAAFLIATPVAVQCLYALGYQNYDTRVMVHSFLGCLFFGVFTAKMLLLPRSDAPGWALPLLGGTAFAALAAIWSTSAYWLFTTFGIHR